MEKHSRRFHLRLLSIIVGLIIGGAFLVSCEDDYYYDEREPEWLGESIYNYLKEDGSFNYYVQIIEELGYDETLGKTGSKTLFVASDSVFNLFFAKENPWGVSSFEQMSKAQKTLLLNFGMINNAYLIETLSNYYDGSLVKGKAMRRATAIEAFDSIPFEKGDMLPKGDVWDKYRIKGLHLLKDATSTPIVYFFKRFMNTRWG